MYKVRNVLQNGHSESSFTHLSQLQMVQVTSHVLLISTASHDFFFFARFLLKPKYWF